MQLLRTKSIEDSIRDTEEPEFKLNRALGPVQLIVFGIGVIIGTGIFVLTGKAAATLAGPSIALAFIASGIACALAALCYAEFASTVPVAGSAYTFSYASLGELIAWIIGWDLILEFAVGAATVSVGWSQYFGAIMKSLGLNIGTSIPIGLSAPGLTGKLNLAAMGIVLLLTVILITGIRISSGVNTVIVAIKLAVVVLFIVVGIFFIKTVNWSPFVPAPGGAGAGGAAGGNLDRTVIDLLLGVKQSAFGISGIFAAAALVFFAYIGFDIVATTAEETRNPQRDMPIGIIGSLIVCTVLYILVSLVMTGIVSYKKLDTAAPMATAFQAIGHNEIAGLVSLGAIAGITSVMMILILGQSRIFFAMSRDHLLPPVFAKVHPRFRTPYVITIIIGVVCALLGGLLDLTALADLVNIGTLFAFVLVSIGVIVLRRTRPDLPRAFRAPAVPVLPVLAALSCLYLMLNLTVLTWLRFFAWMLVGFVIYFGYGYRHSRVRGTEPAEPVAAEARGRPALH